MSKEEPLSTRIRRLSSWRYRRLVFPHHLENTFVAESRDFHLNRQWLEGLLAIGLYILFTAICAEMVSDWSARDTLLRIGVVVPAALLVNTAAYLRLSSGLIDLGTVVVICLAGTIEILANEWRQFRSAEVAHVTILSVLIVANAVMRLWRPYALATLAWAVCAEGFLLLSAPQGKASSQLIPASMVVSAGIMTLVANYGQEREVRLAFLKHAEQKHLVADLSQSNIHLAAAAFTDSLTELPNRSALDTYLRKLWSEPRHADIACSVVVVDIDHFKTINDRFGHLYGDRVLKRVANLLAEALRGDDDLVARFGGEEFVVVLPRTPAHLGMIVAERLRGVVELAGFPSLRITDPSWAGLRATISCGVTAGTPRLYPDPYALVKAADVALYEAKRDGRNLVRSYSSSRSATTERNVWR